MSGWLFKLLLQGSLGRAQEKVCGARSERAAFEDKIVMLKVWARACVLVALSGFVVGGCGVVTCGVVEWCSLELLVS